MGAFVPACPKDVSHWIQSPINSCTKPSSEKQEILATRNKEIGKRYLPFTTGTGTVVTNPQLLSPIQVFQSAAYAFLLKTENVKRKKGRKNFSRLSLSRMNVENHFKRINFIYVLSYMN